MPQKVVITVKEQKCCSKVLKIIVGVPGRQSIASDKNQIVLIGDGIDVIGLMTQLKKKVRCTELVSVGHTDYDPVQIPVGGNYSYSPYAYGPGYGYETNNQSPYAYGPGYGYETKNQSPYAYGPGRGYETTNQNPHAFGPGREYETTNQNPGSCCSIM